jgi:DNA polymerase III epsilon subunit-like protein
MADEEAIPTLCFGDVESTGLDPRVHRPWEIAAIIREPGLPDEEHVFQLRPDLSKADPEALQINRFEERFAVPDGVDATWRINGDGPWRLQLHEAVTEIQLLLADTHLVAAVPSFDDGMLKALMWDHQRLVRWKYRLVCVETLVCGALRRPVPEGLKAAADLMGVKYDPDELHTALGDARLARDVYDAVMAGGAR